MAELTLPMVLAFLVELGTMLGSVLVLKFYYCLFLFLYCISLMIPFVILCEICVFNLNF